MNCLVVNADEKCGIIIPLEIVNHIICRELYLNKIFLLFDQLVDIDLKTMN